MTKILSDRISKERLRDWLQRNQNSPEMVTPIVLVNVIHGDKTGVVLNMSKDAPLPNVFKILVIAAEQVQKEMERRN